MVLLVLRASLLLVSEVRGKLNVCNTLAWVWDGASRTERHVVSVVWWRWLREHETKGRGGGLVEQIQKKQKRESVWCVGVWSVCGDVCVFGEG